MESVLNVVQVVIRSSSSSWCSCTRARTPGSRAPSGIGASGGSVGGSLVERNLDRWTIFFGILFVVNTLVLLKI